MNTALSKSYIIESLGSKAGIDGSNFFIDKSFFEYIRNIVKNDEILEVIDENDLFVKQNIHYGILSMSSRWNSILMWSHYAEFHKGYCAGFWEDKMRESGLFGKGGPVTYNPENDYPKINPLKEYKPMIKGFIETNTKANDWSYENEYRLFNLYFPEIPTKEDRKIIAWERMNPHKK